MPYFTPIRVPGDLPAPGASQETFALDFKGALDAYRKGQQGELDQYEMAKDMAAFANNTGGTILIGAVERKVRGTLTGVLEKYCPMTEAEAGQACALLSAAVGRCSPPPVVDAVVVECGAGHLAAVNVWPFAGQPVGVRLKGAEEAQRPAFVFPVRSGNQTIFLQASQIAMLSIPALRAVAARLDSIKPDPAGLRLVRLLPTDGIKSNGAEVNVHQARFHLVDLPVGENCAVFEGESQVPLNARVRIPLDFIRTAWRATDREWNVIVLGAVIFTPEGGRFVPALEFIRV